MRILIANRGEIARRIIRTAHRLGHQTVAVFADPDADAPFVREAGQAVRIGPADLSESYLSSDRILQAARTTGANAVHPGYGFLSENAGFARAVTAAGLTWIGPRPEAIESMGSKIQARRLAVGAGVPIIPGFDTSQDRADLGAAAERIGFPVLVKAAAGGGGKGIRIVHESSGFDAALDEAIGEADRSFGDTDMIVERYIQRPRHVEVQIVGDKHGNLIDLGTRECSVQRRYQKLLEEAPAPNLPDATRNGLRESARLLGHSIGYDSAGTVEFVVDDETGDYFFLEMNTRLQVEHPVTEAVTGLDLVELMIGSAAGDELAFVQEDVTHEGHAIEARINAEDSARGFVPQIGTVSILRVPPGVRWESAIEEGSEISPHYDAMVAKLIVYSPDRPTALGSMATALDTLILGGVVTNTGFHRWLLEQPPIVAGRVTTRFLDEATIPAEREVPTAAERAAGLVRTNRRSVAKPNPWDSLHSFALTPGRPERPVLLRDLDGEVHVSSPRFEPDVVGVAQGEHVAVNEDGHSHFFTVVHRSSHWAPPTEEAHGSAGAIVSPFPAVVAEVHAEPGQDVASGEVLVVVEAMKMLHSLKAAGPGTVAEVRVSPGEQVASNQLLVTFTEI
jgi:acetyl/propionyl-CoA carboxylase alpha subunit